MSEQPTRNPNLSDDEFIEKAKAGGVTRRVVDQREIVAGEDRGYAVGGVRNRDGQSFPEKPVRISELTPEVVKQHITALRAHYGADNPQIAEGAWRIPGPKKGDEDHVVLDGSAVRSRYSQAHLEGREGKQDAIFDVHRDRDIDLWDRAGRKGVLAPDPIACSHNGRTGEFKRYVADQSKKKQG